MVRSAPSRRAAGRSLAKVFATDPLAAVLTVLREAGPDRELRAEEVKQALVERGVPADRLQVWRRVQERLVAHERVGIGGDRYHRTYRWLPEPPPPTPDQALALLAEHRLPAQRRVELVEVLRAALAGQAGAASRPATDPVLVAQLEQRERDAVRALAELAIEVEELVTNEASARAVVHTVRSLTKLADLRPIERAGEMTRFDRTRHTSVGGRIADGAPVLVLRPGYMWNRGDEEVLIARAVVQDRSPS
ncbi:MAG: hypothetical protein IRY85_19175 [Micromonosporaceae bacterium]|nr:hypothetical protein [Micromonosporaceae bacterium]